jgi:hypothetical protein
MTDNIIHFRPADGTNAQDLADIRAGLRRGWHASTADGDAPWIALDAPDGDGGEVLRQDGQFLAALTMGSERHVELGGHRSARDAAAAIVAAWSEAHALA